MCSSFYWYHYIVCADVYCYSGFAVIFAEDVPDVPTQDFTTGRSFTLRLWKWFKWARRCLASTLPRLQQVRQHHGTYLNRWFSASVGLLSPDDLPYMNDSDQTLIICFYCSTYLIWVTTCPSLLIIQDYYKFILSIKHGHFSFSSTPVLCYNRKMRSVSGLFEPICRVALPFDRPGVLVPCTALSLALPPYSRLRDLAWTAALTSRSCLPSRRPDPLPAYPNSSSRRRVPVVSAWPTYVLFPTETEQRVRTVKRMCPSNVHVLHRAVAALVAATPALRAQ